MHALGRRRIPRSVSYGGRLRDALQMLHEQVAALSADNVLVVPVEHAFVEIAVDGVLAQIEYRAI